MKTYHLKPDRASLALRGLLDTVLFAAQAAVVMGEAAPRAALRTLEHAITVLRRYGYETGDRHAVMGQRTAGERDLIGAMRKQLRGRN